MIRSTALFSLLLLLLASPGPSKAGQAFDQNAKFILRLVGDSVREQYKNRARRLELCHCSVDQCGSNEFGDMSCETFDRAAVSFCSNSIPNDECSGTKFDFTRSVVSLPRGAAQSANYNEVLEDICITQGLDVEKIFQRATFPIESTKNEWKGWTYFGTTSGILRSWPATPAADDVCDQGYDPRKRPWYIGATSGPKDVVVMLQATGQKGHWGVAKDAMRHLWDTFEFFDLVNIVTFDGESARPLFGDAFVNANATTKNKMEAMRKMSKEDRADYVMSFRTVFDLFRSTIEEHKEMRGSSPRAACQKVIILISHSSDCSQIEKGGPCSSSSPNAVLNEIDQQQRELWPDGNRVSIFTYTIGNDVDPSLHMQIACENDGVHGNFPLTRDTRPDPLTILNGYFQFLVLVFNNEGALWSEPYDDAGGLGRVTTIAMPVFADEQAENPGCLLGVVGHDILEDELNISLDVLLEPLSEKRKCTGSQITQNACYLQSIRSTTDQCPGRQAPSTCHKYTTLLGSTKWYMNPKNATAVDPIKASFKEAEEFCRAKGGQLAQPVSSEEQHVLASIVPPEGSWVGVVKKGGTRQWRVLQSTNDLDSFMMNFWVVNSEENGVEENDLCGVLDPRSREYNVRVVDCTQAQYFLCQFEDAVTADACQGGAVLDVSATMLKKSMDHPVPELRCGATNRCHRMTETNVEETEILCNIGVKDWAHDEVACCEECPVRLNGGVHVPSEALYGGISGGIVFLAAIFALPLLFFKFTLLRHYSPTIPWVKPLVQREETLVKLNLDLNKDDIVMHALPCVIGTGTFGKTVRVMFRDNIGDYIGAALREVPEVGGRECSDFRAELSQVSLVSRHANIVHCHGGRVVCAPDSGTDSDNQVEGGSADFEFDNFIVEEVLDQNLHGYLARDSPNGFPVEKVYKIGLDIASGLEHLHSMGIVHCDIHPGNILIQTTGGQQSGGGLKAKISDSGVSRLKNRRLIESILEGGNPPPYFAPEQVPGFAPSWVKVTVKTDVYALGILLLYCLTGKCPARWQGGWSTQFGRVLCTQRKWRGRQESNLPFLLEDMDCGVLNRVPPGFQALIEDCTRCDHRCRPTCSEVRRRLALMQGKFVLTNPGRDKNFV